MVNNLINFRDFGGALTANSTRVRPGIWFRSGDLRKLNPVDLENLVGMNFELVLDLRYQSERLSAPSPWPPHMAASILHYEGVADKEAPHLSALKDGTLDAELADALYVSIYRDFVSDQSYTGLLRSLFFRLRSVEGPILVHCTAGKDRTGMVAALIQHALGMSRSAILEEYLKSNEWAGLAELGPPLAKNLAATTGRAISVRLVDELLRVRRHFLEAFFLEIEAKFGSLDAYLDHLGCDGDQQRRLRQKCTS